MPNNNSTDSWKDDTYRKVENGFSLWKKERETKLFLLAEKIRQCSSIDTFKVLQNEYNQYASELGSNYPKINYPSDPMFGDENYLTPKQKPTFPKKQSPKSSVTQDLDYLTKQLKKVESRLDNYIHQYELVTFRKKKKLKFARKMDLQLRQDLLDKIHEIEFTSIKQEDQKQSLALSSRKSLFVAPFSPKVQDTIDSIFSVLTEISKFGNTYSILFPQRQTIDTHLKSLYYHHKFDFFNLKKDIPISQRLKQSILVFNASGIRIDYSSSEIRLPTIGWIKLSGLQPSSNEIMSVTLSKDYLNRWLCTIRYRNY